MLVQTFEINQNGVDLYKLVSDKAPSPRTMTKDDWQRTDYFFYHKDNPGKLYTGIVDIYENTLPENFIESGPQEGDSEISETEMIQMIGEIF